MKGRDEVDRLQRALLSITPTQQLAVEAIVGGASHQEAADAAGVTRETVTRWVGHSPAVRASLNLYRLTIAIEQLDLARRIRSKALKAVETGLDAGSIDPLAVLRILGDSSPAVGRTVPQEILDNETLLTQLGAVPQGISGDPRVEFGNAEGRPLSSDERATWSTVVRILRAAGMHDALPDECT